MMKHKDQKEKHSIAKGKEDIRNTKYNKMAKEKPNSKALEKFRRPAYGQKVKEKEN